MSELALLHGTIIQDSANCNRGTQQGQCGYDHLEHGVPHSVLRVAPSSTVSSRSRSWAMVLPRTVSKIMTSNASAPCLRIALHRVHFLFSVRARCRCFLQRVHRLLAKVGWVLAVTPTYISLVARQVAW